MSLRSIAFWSALTLFVAIQNNSVLAQGVPGSEFRLGTRGFPLLYELRLRDGNVLGRQPLVNLPGVAGTQITFGPRKEYMLPVGPDDVDRELVDLPVPGRTSGRSDLRTLDTGLCQKTVAAIMPWVSGESSTWDPLSDERKQQLAAYDRECLKKIAEMDAKSGQLQLLQASAILSYNLNGNRLRFCSAFLINRVLAVTARHCFYEKSSGVQIGRADPARAGNDIRLHPAFDLASWTKVTGLKPGKAYETAASVVPSAIVHENDFVFLTLAPVGWSVPTAEPGQAAPGNPLVVIGDLFYLTRLLVTRATSVDVARAAAPPALRWDGARSCVRLRQAGACVYHGCQTSPAFSGAPVFLNNGGGRLVLVGLHIGDRLNRGGCPISGDPVGNIAITVPDELKKAMTGGPS
jgi:hypothetical protein